MSEKRRRKRTRKANSTSMRSLQARESEPSLQAETKPMPQQEGEGLAETDTTNTKQQGGNKMYGQSFGDRIREHRTTIIQVIVVMAIAVVISALMITGLAATKGALSAEADRVDAEFAGVTTHINTLGSQFTDQLSDVRDEVEGYNSTLDILGTKAATNSYNIDLLATWKDEADARITTVEAQSSPPEGYLTGTVGNYTLHAKCSEAGNFTANVHLVYSPTLVVSGTTYNDALTTFYGSVNWTGPAIKDYVAVLIYNSTAWSVSQVWFNIGAFVMTANNVTALPVVFSGLNSTYTPSFTYTEVWPVLK